MIVAPDAEAVALAALRRVLPAVRMGTMTPPGEMPDPFIRLRRIGGQMRSPFQDEARIDALVFGGDAASRMALALTARAVLLGLRGSTVAGVQVYEVTEALGPQRVPDPYDSARETVLFTIDLAMRATEAP